MSVLCRLKAICWYCTKFTNAFQDILTPLNPHIPTPYNQTQNKNLKTSWNNRITGGVLHRLPQLWFYYRQSNEQSSEARARHFCFPLFFSSAEQRSWNYRPYIYYCTAVLNFSAGDIDCEFPTLFISISVCVHLNPTNIERMQRGMKITF